MPSRRPSEHKKPGRKPGIPAVGGKSPSESTRPTSGRVLPGLRRPLETLPRNANAIHRRHSERSPTGRDRACHSSRLVPGVQKEGRTGGARRLARLAAGPSRVGAHRVAALRLGQHALADRGGLQLPPAVEAHAAAGWCRCGIACRKCFSAGTNNFKPRPSNPQLACRRNRLAGQRKNPLVVVFLTTPD